MPVTQMPPSLPPMATVTEETMETEAGSSATPAAGEVNYCHGKNYFLIKFPNR